MNQLPATVPVLSVHTLDAYMRHVNSIPMLTSEEEYEFGMRLKLQNDLEAAQRLILSHLRFVVRIARDFSGYGLPVADLIQEGNIGLMKAVKRFNPEVGVRLVSFAVHWVKAEIHEFVLRNWRIVKIATTKAQRKLFFNLRKARKRLGWMSQEEISDVAKALDVEAETVMEMEKRMNNYDMAFDAPVEDEDDTVYAPGQYLEDQAATPEERVVNEDWQHKTHNKLFSALESLDERAQDIIRRRWLNDEKATLHELAAEYGVSAERIRQLENAAMVKMKGAI